jgi:hypothetical protein
MDITTNSVALNLHWLRQLLVAIMALAATQFASAQGPITMNQKTISTEIHSCPDLRGFWVFGAANGVHYGVFEHDAQKKHSAMSLGRIDAAGQATLLRRTEIANVSVIAMDARAIGADLAFVYEINHGLALQVVRTPAASLLAAGSSKVKFQAAGTPGMSASRQASIHLSSGDLWNVADILGPEEWLFGARLVQGSAQADVVANSADGQAFVLGSALAEAWPAIADAAEPQALESAGRLWLAYRRFALPYRPFWSLPRYSTRTRPSPATLWVSEGGGVGRDLSTALGLGDVQGFSLVSDGNGQPWIFALRPAGAVSRLTALTRHPAGQWAVAQEWLLSTPAEQLVVLNSGRAWHVVYAVHAADGWTLRYLRAE